MLEACGESWLLQLSLSSHSTPGQVRSPGAASYLLVRDGGGGGLPHTRGSGAEVRGPLTERSEGPQEVTAGMGWGSMELWLGLEFCVPPALFLGLVSPFAFTLT